MVAALATLNHLEDGTCHRYANDLGERLHKGASEIIADSNIPAQVTSVGSIFNIHFGVTEPVTTPRIAWKADQQKRFEYQIRMINEGIFMKPGAGYARVSAAHSVHDIESTLDKMKSVLPLVSNGK
jgi:glutamate-1-semialdehyde aminotransferase